MKQTGLPRDDGVDISVREKYGTFRCVHCGARWVTTYEVRDYLGAKGFRWSVHSRNGEPVPAPMFGDRCPSCGLVSVPLRIEQRQVPPAGARPKTG